MSSQRSVLLAGATGLVGRELLEGLLADASIGRVIAIGRTPPPVDHYKLYFERVEFAIVPDLPPLAECYIALGTTIKAAGSQRAFRAIDYDAVINTALAARYSGARRLGVVSAMGASVTSSVFYSRVKGEMEDALSAMNFEALVIARPSMLAGDRTAIGQEVRGGEQLAMKVSRWLGKLIPENYQSIPAGCVARALLANVPTATGRRVMLSGELRKY